MAEGEEPIIVKKCKKCEGGHHGGAWKVAFADFMTSMMALFIVLWILGQSEEVKNAVAGYFKDPVGFTAGGSKNPIKGNPNKANNPDIMKNLEKRRKEKEKLGKIGKDIRAKLKKNEKFKKLVGKHIQVEVTDEGLRIELIESAGEGFFGLSTATLNPTYENLIKEIGNELGQLNNKIIIEGHTDARQYPGSKTGYSNFELSADRANAARRALIKGGLRENQIAEIRGWAANKLKDVSNPLDPSNRRISIIVKFNPLDLGGKENLGY